MTFYLVPGAVFPTKMTKIIFSYHVNVLIGKIKDTETLEKSPRTMKVFFFEK